MTEPCGGDGDVSSADVMISKNPNGTGSPLSEVGFNPTSAGPSGLNNENASVNGVPTEFFTQMLQMMKHMSDRMTTQPDTPKVKTNEVFLPSYDPDANIGVREWCQHVTTAMETYDLSDYEVRMKVGSLLKGRARLWVDNWLVSTTTWQELRDVLITTFEPENRYSRDIVRFREHNYDNSKDIAQFLSQAWVLWRRITKDKLSNDDAVEAVIGCIGDERLRIELLNTRAKSVPELISVASSIRSIKSPQSGTSVAHPGLAKRPRFDKPSLFCQICKKPGHDARDCRYRDKNGNSQPRQHDKTSPQNIGKPMCTFCSRIGHTYDTCYKRESAVVSNVNYVGTSKLNLMQVVAGNLNILAIFDSGAECSVIRESVAAKLPGQRVDRVSYLKGLGQFTVISLSTLTTICVIDSLRIELEFHVVPDYEVCSDILIGINLVEKNNLSVVVNSRGVTLVHQPVVYHVRSQSEKFDNLNCDLTNDDQINELKILLNKFESLFIHGYPCSRVNTGELEVRLKDDSKCVERRLYRLRPVERENVREIVNELLEHDIISESKSPFSSPITNIKKEEWNERHDEARNHIIQHLSTAPTLMLFQEDAPIELYTDASSIGYEAVLVHTVGGRQHSVAYMSQRTTDAESRCHSYELETLAVVRAVKHFRHYIYGRKLKVITDCNALKASKNKKNLLPRIHRWWAFLQNYEFQVEYRKGERLQHADFFSTNPYTEMSVNLMTRDTEWLQIEQRRHDVLRPLIDTMSGNSPAEGYVLEEGVLKKMLTDSILGIHKPIVVPRSFQWSLINSFHVALQHPRWEKTLQKLRETYWFHKMNTIVSRFVDNCVVCKTSKGPSGAIQAQLHPIQKPTAAFQVIHIDITGKLGTRSAEGRDEYVIVTIDAYTKFILLSYSNDKSTSSSLAALKRVVHLFGTPVQVVVDGGREFLGEFKVYSDRFGIDIHSIAPGVSRANGQVERIMGTLKNALTMIKNYDTEEWQTALEALQLAFNCTPQRVTGVAPLTLLARRQHNVPPELLRLVNINNECIDFDLLEQHVQEKMTAAGQYEKQRFDRSKAKMRPFQRGDYVLVKNNPRNQTSLDLKYSEPYEIYKILDNDRYIVKRVTGRGRPRKVAHDQLRRAPQPGEQETVSTNNEDDPQQVALRLAEDSSTNLVDEKLQQNTSQIISTPPSKEPQPSTSLAAQLLDR